MASVGPNNPGTATTDSAVGTQTWYNINNILSSNNSRALSYSSIPSAVSYYAKATNFGFSIPAGATIDGIVVEIERSANNNAGSNRVVDEHVKIVKGGTIGSTNKADTATNWPTTDAYKTYGGATDLWGETWTYSDINASNFGAVIASRNYTDSGATEAYIDHIRITVYYTESAGSTFVSRIISY